MSLMVSQAEVPLTYVEIKERLRAHLRDYPPGAQLPPIKRLAEQMGLGQTNTHRAVQELVKEGLLASRRGRGTFVCRGGDARAHADAGALAGKTVVVLHSSPDGFQMAAIGAAADALAEQGAQVRRERVAIPDLLPALARHAGADAVVLVNPHSQVPLQVGPAQLLALVSTVPDLMLTMPGRYDLTSVDAEHGGFLVGRHLRRLGWRSVCFLGRRAPHDPQGGYDTVSALRLRGLEQGWGQPVSLSCRLMCDRYMSETGARSFADYLHMDPRPQAVFCASDDLAIGFAHGGLAHGLVAGRDYQLVGFDGQQRGRQLLPAPLTTVDAPMAQMGQAAAAMLSERFQAPDRPVRRLALGCTLFAGGTANAVSSDAPGSSTPAPAQGDTLRSHDYVASSTQ